MERKFTRGEPKSEEYKVKPLTSMAHPDCNAVTQKHVGVGRVTYLSCDYLGTIDIGI